MRTDPNGATSNLSPARRRRQLIMSKFNQFLEAHPDKPLQLKEICKSIGVPERTLRTYCDKHLGMGPHARASNGLA